MYLDTMMKSKLDHSHTHVFPSEAVLLSCACQYIYAAYIHQAPPTSHINNESVEY